MVGYFSDLYFTMLCIITCSHDEYACSVLLAHDAFVRTNRHNIAMMFVCLSGMGMHCDYTVLFSTDLSLPFIIQCSGHLDTKACSPTPKLDVFQFHLEERWVMDVQTRRSITR